MKEKLQNAKKELFSSKNVNVLSEDDLSFITGGASSASTGGAGSSSTSGDVCCDNTCVCVCNPQVM